VALAILSWRRGGAPGTKTFSLWMALFTVQMISGAPQRSWWRSV
jgi:hypothetical protein